TPCGEPVVVVAVKNDCRVSIDAEFLDEVLELLLRSDVAANGIDEVGMPDHVLRAGDMTTFKDAGFDADLDDPPLRGIQILLKPFACDERSCGCACLRRCWRHDGCDADGRGQ